MKRAIFLFLILTLALFPAAVTAFADQTDGKTVDGNADRWAQESTRSDTLATMEWDEAADTLHFSGTGYADNVGGMKFGFRSNIKYTNAEVGVKIKFPETFSALYTDQNNMHFVVAFVDTWKAWFNGNSVKSAAFIIRPKTNDKISVELVGSTPISGYTDISSAAASEYTLSDGRILEFSFKKTEGNVVSAYVNGEELGSLDKELTGTGGKTMSDFISEFEDGVGYLQFGATLEGDTESLPMEFTVTELTGAVDAFRQPETKPDDADEPVVQKDVKSYGKSKFNLNYVLLYGVSGAIGVAAVVCFVLSARKGGGV